MSEQTLVDTDTEPHCTADYVQMGSPDWGRLGSELDIWHDGFHWATHTDARRVPHGAEIAAVDDGEIIARGTVETTVRDGFDMYVWAQPDENMEW